MKIILPIIFILMMSCSKNEDINGVWKLAINIQNNELPVLIQLKESQSNITGELYNSSEKIKLVGTLKDNTFEISIGANYATLVGQMKNGKLVGNWIRTNKKDYKVPFLAEKSGKKSLFKTYEKKPTLLNISGKWKVKLDEDKFGLGLFKQVGSRIQGSILTNTGDYRYLDGYIEKNQAKLYGFDGVFSFILDLVLTAEHFQATMYSGKSYNAKISGTKDDEFKLLDPNTMTSIQDVGPLKLNLNDINGEEINLEAGKYKNKAKVIQIFGSWCPNCIDETKYFLKWRKANVAKLNDVEFLAVAYENFKTKKEAIKKLRKFRIKMELDYPMAIGDYSSTKTVTKLFPIDKTRAFPTTLYLNKRNEIIKVHTGFSGQATGEFFQGFKDDFNQTIDALIKDD